MMKPKKNEFTLAGFLNGVLRGNTTKVNEIKKKEEKKEEKKSNEKNNSR